MTKRSEHPLLSSKWNFGQKAADKLTSSMGSWTFIVIFLLLLIAWIYINGYYLLKAVQGVPFDPFPFILLNLALSCLAAIQAPIILMSQKRSNQKDRLRAEYDYSVNRAAKKEIEELKKQLNRVERFFKKK